MLYGQGCYCRDTFEERFLNEERLSGLQQLQVRLCVGLVRCATNQWTAEPHLQRIQTAETRRRHGVQHVQVKVPSPLSLPLRCMRHIPDLLTVACSFCSAQNEGIVKWLMDKHPEARLEPIQRPIADACTRLHQCPATSSAVAESECKREEPTVVPTSGSIQTLRVSGSNCEQCVWGRQSSLLYRAGGNASGLPALAVTARIEPALSHTSALYIARIRKPSA